MIFGKKDAEKKPEKSERPAEAEEQGPPVLFDDTPGEAPLEEAPADLFGEEKKEERNFIPGKVQIPGLRKEIRVAISENLSQLTINSLGRLELLEVNGDLNTKLLDLRGEFKIVRNEEFTDVYFPPSKKVRSVKGDLWVRPMSNLNLLEIADLKYRGSFIFKKYESTKFLIINRVDVESYLRGVLPYEMPSGDRSALEALKAQAIAARNYAMANLGQYEELGFDVYSDTRDQVYNGTKAETFLSDKAVESTRGLMLVHRGKLATCYYHSTCGGKTANIHEVWRGDSVEYLSSQSDLDSTGAPYCRSSKYSHWYEKWKKPALVRIVEKHQKSARIKEPKTFGNILNLSVTQNTQSGRVKELSILTDGGKLIVRGDKTRWALRRDTDNFPILHSSWFRVLKKGPVFLVEGKGFGHGIGMCQVGAMERARRGANFAEILKAYYAGSEIVEQGAGED